jgi:hypothetical protein
MGVHPGRGHVDPAGGVGEHLEAVVFGLLGVLFYLEDLVFLPLLLPFRLDVLK